MSDRMSETFQAVQFFDSFTGDGYSPAFTLAHQVELHTGMIGGWGGLALGFPIICDNLR